MPLSTLCSLTKLNILYSYQSLDLLQHIRNDTDLTSFLIGGYFGLMTIMAIYNLLIYFSLKDKAYLLYVGTTFFSILTVLSTNRLNDQFIWPTYKGLDSWIYLVFAGISMFFSSRFASVFLQLKERHKLLDKLMWIIATLSLLLSVLSSILTVEQVTPFGRSLVLLSFPTYIGVAIYAYRKGFKLAKYYIIAWIPYVLGLIAMTLHGAEVLPSYFVVVFALEIGGALEIILLSFALAYRIKGMRLEITQKELEKEQFKTKLLQDQKIVLEQQVKKRTAELTKANQTKDKFFSIIAHDLRSPMIGLQGVGQKLTYFIKKEKQEKLLKLGSQIDTSIDQLNHLLNNLLNWAVSQTGGISYKPKEIDISAIIEENVALYKSLAKTKNVEIQTDINSTTLYADENSVCTIVRNLLSNAIKFTPENTSVLISSYKEKDLIYISITDKGKGIPEDEIATIFKDELLNSSVGTAGEKGFGLGLQLCKEFTKMNQGTISVKSILDKETSFMISFPEKNTFASLN